MVRYKVGPYQVVITYYTWPQNWVTWGYNYPTYRSYNPISHPHPLGHNPTAPLP